MLSHSPLRAPFPPGLAPLALTFAGPFQISRGRAFAGSLRFVFRAVVSASAGSLGGSRLPLLACFASGLASRPPLTPLLNRSGFHAVSLAFAGSLRSSRFRARSCLLASVSRHRWLAVGFAFAGADLLLTPSLSPSLSRYGLTLASLACFVFAGSLWPDVLVP